MCSGGSATTSSSSFAAIRAATSGRRAYASRSRTSPVSRAPSRVWVRRSSPMCLAEARGEGLERVRELGIRSSLRSPIVIGGRTELVLVVSWTTVIDEPDPTTIAIVRRFADQAGLAFEQLERRRAEERAAARADETERLLEMTCGPLARGHPW